MFICQAEQMPNLGLYNCSWHNSKDVKLTNVNSNFDISQNEFQEIDMVKEKYLITKAHIS